MFLQGLSGGRAIILSIPVTALLAVKLTKVKFKNNPHLSGKIYKIIGGRVYFIGKKGGDAAELLSIIISFTPILGDVKDLIDLLAGKDVITGEELNRGLMLLVLVTPMILDKPLKVLAKEGITKGDELAEALMKVGKSADEIITDAIMKIKNKLKGSPDEVFEYVTETKDMGNYINCKTVDNVSADIPKSELTDAEEEILLGGCFTGDTLVETKNGPKRIDEIKKGDLVLAKNVMTEEIDYKEVKEVHVKSISNLFNLVVSGELIETTPSHLFMKDNGVWVEAEKLEIGDKIITSSNEVKVVESAEKIIYNESIKVYDLTVDEFSTYFVGKDRLLVHNNACSIDITIFKLNKALDSVDENKIHHILNGSSGTASGHAWEVFFNGSKPSFNEIKSIIIDSYSQGEVVDSVSTNIGVKYCKEFVYNGYTVWTQIIESDYGWKIVDAGVNNW